MDIFAIIKENLPDGVELGDKAIKAIAKEISTQQGQEFIPKESYSKKTERIDELEKEIKDLKELSADADNYKTKWENEKTARENLEKSHTAEKIAESKRAILHKQLAAEGANPKLLKLLEKEFDLAALELDGEGDTAKIKGWDKLSAPVKEQYADVFGKVETTGANVADPPPGKPKPAVNKDMNAFIRGVV